MRVNPWTSQTYLTQIRPWVLSVVPQLLRNSAIAAGLVAGPMVSLLTELNDTCIKHNEKFLDLVTPKEEEGFESLLSVISDMGYHNMSEKFKALMADERQSQALATGPPAPLVAAVHAAPTFSTIVATTMSCTTTTQALSTTTTMPTPIPTAQLQTASAPAAAPPTHDRTELVQARSGAANPSPASAHSGTGQSAVIIHHKYPSSKDGEPMTDLVRQICESQRECSSTPTVFIIQVQASAECASPDEQLASRKAEERRDEGTISSSDHGNDRGGGETEESSDDDTNKRAKAQGRGVPWRCSPRAANVETSIVHNEGTKAKRSERAVPDISRRRPPSHCRIQQPSRSSEGLDLSLRHGGWESRILKDWAKVVRDAISTEVRLKDLLEARSRDLAKSYERLMVLQ